MSARDVDPGVANRLRDAMAIANIPVLICLLVQMTGDRKWLSPPYAPGVPRGVSDNDSGGLSEQAQDEVRAAASDAILRWRAGRPLAIPSPTDEQFTELLRLSMGGTDIPAGYGPMMKSEYLAARLGSPEQTWPAPTGVVVPTGLRVPDEFRALIIGAGVSGLTAAMVFAEAGIPYTIIERNPDVGGTWTQNTYPGAGVDTPNHLYSWPGIPYDWKHYFSLRDDLHAYLIHVAAANHLRPHIRFSTSVVRAVYNAQTQGWEVDVIGPDGPQRHSADILVSAVGLFNAPKIPDVPGLESFEGSAFHTAQWPADLKLSGTRVAVIGNGASAMQVVPAIVDQVQSLALFQRSPQWMAPFEKLHTEVPEPVRFLLSEVPLYQWWYRARLNWTFNDKVWASLQKDPAWPHPERSVNAVNDKIREIFTDYIRRELSGRPELLPQVIPNYPPYGKRILLDNGWYRALRKEHVTLITSGIDRITRGGVIAQDGRSFDVERIVLATGFHAVRFLSTFEVVGRDGRTLREVWDTDDARAYLGTVVPGFPNLFILYGPNLQGGHGGSFMSTVGSQMQYVINIVEAMLAAGAGAVDCRPDVWAQFNTEVDAAHENMIWTHPGMDTYYRNSRGRVTVNHPYRNVDYWHRVRRAGLEDFIVEASRARTGPVLHSV
jgi:4-hydroxyacetophenone monooxygenase